ncbi:AAA family ATPase [Pseudonocardia endophytica]|uniref:CO dehydrogenase maturation factor n=1 Tax=Pseudonocardia endophytica TaxID=401976 RepID=A0A4V2PHQ0_PSEEN|nr:AAA family ATPase [Pseudonocardia endophytica]TCK21626.1 CO dehydrogenase maturation factor [Pseudonocardia endophytica]
MRIAFVGKGGSGKTTTAAMTARCLASTGAPVLAVDADINQHLGVALGADPDGTPPPSLAADLPWLKEHLRGDNPLIGSSDEMVKTTPPGPGSRLSTLDSSDPVLARLSRSEGGVRYVVTGEFDADDVGVKCFHSKTGAVELYLNHLVDGPGEYVVVDMTAGADAFASGLFTRFDLTVLVCEPTRRGVGVYRQYAGHAAEYGVALRVLGNKVADSSDVDYLRDEVGDALIGWIGQSAWVRAAERGRALPVSELEPANRAVCDELRSDVDARSRDWAAYHRDTVAFHLRNARSWANAATGVDLALQVAPDYVPGPAPARV